MIVSNAFMILMSTAENVMTVVTMMVSMLMMSPD